MFLFLLLLVSSIFSKSSAQQRISNISQGSSLTPTSISYWSSVSGHFAFGFYQKRDGYGIGIWMPRIQQKTVVWTANLDDSPLPANATLTLDEGGRLILKKMQGEQVHISDSSQSASSASMLDSGNFVLYNAEFKIIWQTFDVPTDTLLPGQRLLTGKELVSSISNTNHTSGRFGINMRENGNLVMFSTEYPFRSEYFYWRSRTSDAGENVTLNLDGNGQLYLLNTNGLTIKTLNRRNISGEAMYRATMEADGIFRLYSHNLDQYGDWSIRQQIPADNNCAPIGLCGSNSYCKLVDRSPECACLPGFEFIDKTQKNLGCQWSFSSDICQGRNFIIQELENNVEWKINEPYSILTATTKQVCKEECLRDCSCEAAVYTNQQCKKQKLPLRSGKVTQNSPGITFIKVSNGSLATKVGASDQKEDVQEGILITCIVISAIAIFVLTSCGFVFYRYRVWNYRKIASQGNDELFEDVVLRSFTYEELKEATKNFKDEIGRGGFGTVFTGFMSNGNRVVAVKMLQNVVAEGEREFRNEMNVIGRTHHRNLVRLFGYCHDGTNRLLVYEYMSGGSLADFIFESEQKPAWEARIEIALNIARGIVYLHEECETQIIHCDIKPENILMDEKEWAKIADFGLSKLLMPNQSRTYTGFRGTRGYVAPEWHSNLPITVKVDVYSFGIMLLEIICCRRNVAMDVADDEVVLANWVYDCFEAKELNKLIEDEEVEKSQLERMVRLGLWCIQDEPSMRPSMKKVVLMLEGIIDIPEPPAAPTFSSSVYTCNDTCT